MYIAKPYFRGMARLLGCVSTGYGISHIVEHTCMGFCARKDSYGDITLTIALIRINANITI